MYSHIWVVGSYAGVCQKVLDNRATTDDMSSFATKIENRVTSSVQTKQAQFLGASARAYSANRKAACSISGRSIRA